MASLQGIISDYDRFSWATCKGGLPDNKDDRVQPIAERIHETIAAIDKWESEHQDDVYDDFKIYPPCLTDHFFRKWTAMDPLWERQRRCLCFSMCYDSSVKRHLGKTLGKSEYDFIAADNFMKYMDNNIPGIQTECEMYGKGRCPCRAFAENLGVDDIKRYLTEAKLPGSWCVISFMS